MILKYELRKIIKKRINRILILLIILASLILSVFAIGSFRFVDKNGKTHNGIYASRNLIEEKNRWKGELTGKSINKIIKMANIADSKEHKVEHPDIIYGQEVQSYTDIIDSSTKMLYGEHGMDDKTEAIKTASPREINKIYDRYRENLKKSSEEYGDTSQKRAYIMNKYRKIKTPMYYEAPDAWDTMLLYVEPLSLILLLIISFITAGIFVEEFRYKADSVFFSSVFGKSKAIKYKVLAGIIMTTVLYWFGIGLLSMICFGVMGTSGVNTMYQFSQPYAIYTVTFGQMYWISIICGYIASLLSSSISMLIASKSKSIAVSIGVPVILFGVLPFVTRILPFKILALMPAGLNNILNNAKIPYVFQVGGTAFSQIGFMMAFYLAIAAILSPFTYICYKRVAVK